MDDLIKQLEESLLKGHRAFLETLNTGRQLGQEIPKEIRALYLWHDGQQGESEFLRDLRFISFNEAAERASEAKRGSIFQKILSRLFAGRILRSYPLLVDISGGGYYFDPLKRNVFLAEEGETHLEIGDFQAFLKRWTLIADKTSESMDDDSLFQIRAEIEIECSSP